MPTPVNNNASALAINSWPRAEVGWEKIQQSRRGWLKKTVSDIMVFVKNKERKRKTGGAGEILDLALPRQPVLVESKVPEISLTNLPPELLLIIVGHLDTVNQVCLQLTCQFFRKFINVDRNALDKDRCRKWAITCFLEKDMKKYPAKIACAVCKTLCKTKDFRDVSHTFWQNWLHPHSFRDCGMTRRAPLGRFCYRHRKDFFEELNAPIKVNEGVKFAREPSYPCWTRVVLLRCWHCARIVAADDNARKAGCLNCLCDVCPRQITEHYYRVGPRRPMSQGLYMWDGLMPEKQDDGTVSMFRAVREVDGM